MVQLIHVIWSNTMAPGKKPILHWKKPFTCVYEDNYDYGFNDYKDVMDWMNHKKKGTFEKPAKVPIFEERIAQHMRYKLGRSLTTANMTDLESLNDPLTKRLEYLKVKSAEQDARSANRLRRVKSYGAFTTKAVKDIEEDIRLDAATSFDGHVDRRRTRSKLLQFDHDEHVKILEQRRSRIDAEDEENEVDQLHTMNKSATRTATKVKFYRDYNSELEEEDLTRGNRTMEVLNKEAHESGSDFWKSRW